MKAVGIGTRTIHALVDNFIIFWLAYAANYAITSYCTLYKMPVPLVFGYVFFITLFVYYFITESIFGRSIAKYLTYSHVVNNQGKKPTIFQIFVRTLARITIIDLFFFPFLEKTLHDYLSKTNVVEK